MTEHTVTLTAEEYARFLMKTTLRDQFAMAALTGITRGTPVSAAQSAATCAYLFADAMLEARKEKK